MRSFRQRLSAVCLAALALTFPPASQALEGQLVSQTGPQGQLVSEREANANAREANANAQEAFCCDRRHLGLTLIDISTVLVLPWYFNRYVADDSTAVIGLDSWKRNIERGFEWDHDNFKTNMFAHPYHGAMYFNAGRSNGYNFWESAAWAWGGSFLWEMFGENNQPAINDWLATAVGGIAIGEMLHRTSLTVWDNTATGTGRTLKEIGGLLLNPMGGASRLFRGEMSKVGPNPADRFPDVLKTSLNVGVRHVGEGGRASSSTGGTVQFNLQYGDPFADYAKPYDSFRLNFTVHGRNEETSLGLLQVRGGLWGTELSRSSKVQHVFRLEQGFDYINNRTIETGGSSLTAGFFSRWLLSERWNLITRVAPGALLLWGVDSEYADFTKREYDFGSGAGLVLGGQLDHDGGRLLSLDYAVTWQHTLNGAAGSHLMSFVIAHANVPLFGAFGLGAEYWLFTRDSNYRDFPDVFRRHPEYSLFVNWALN